KEVSSGCLGDDDCRVFQNIDAGNGAVLRSNACHVSECIASNGLGPSEVPEELHVNAVAAGSVKAAVAACPSTRVTIDHVGDGPVVLDPIE
ncbi:hypothetical protein THAOC_23183, partial [Thalassiosira oceanica]